MAEIDWESGEIKQPEGTMADADWEQGEIKPPPEPKGFLGHARDLGLSAVKSAIAVPETLVGLADIPTGGRVGKFLENKDGAIGFRPKQAKEFLSEFHTDQYKEQQRQFQEADGILDKTAVAIQNPSLIANTVVESAAPMLAGGVAGRAVRAVAPKVGAAAAGAIGEGTMMAGAQAEAIRQETDDGLLTAGQSGAAVATGLAGTLFGYLGGRVAQRLGLGDVDTMLARGANPQQVASEIAALPAKSIPRQVVEGAISEGFLEELPQSISEQVIQNLALGKPWSEGVEDAAVMGTLAGMAMGGGASLYSGMTRPEAQDGGLPPPAAGTEPPAAPPQGFTPAAERPVIDEAALGRAGVYPPAPAPIINERALEPAAPLPSQQMGLDPAAGPMSAAAVLAVDTGASATMQQAAQAVDPETGEILEAGAKVPEQKQATDTPEQMRERLGFIEQQARVNGRWDRRTIEERDRLQAELAKVEPVEIQTPATEQSTAEGAEPAPAIDVTGRTDDQLRVLEKSGRDGWREAAVAEIQRRAAQQPAETTSPAVEPAVQAAVEQQASAPSMKDVLAKQIPDMTDDELQQAIDHYGPSNKRTVKLLKEVQRRRQGAPAAAVQPTQTPTAPEQSRPAPSPRSESAQQSEAIPPATSEGWDGMAAEQRTAILTKPGGWSTAKGKLNVIGKQIAGRNWSAINPTTRATIERLMQGEQAANVPPTQQMAPQTQEAGGQEGEKAKWIKATVDKSRLNGSGGVQLAVAPNGGVTFLGDPNTSKDGKALLANYEKALAAGATQQEIAAALQVQTPAPSPRSESAQPTSSVVPAGVTLNQSQKAELAQGGSGMAGEIGEQTMRSLAAMRNNPNVPSPAQDAETGAYSPSDLPEFQDVGDGFSVRGYALRQRVVQEIKLPNGMIARRALNADGTVYGEFEGDYDQIVGRKGFAEAEQYFRDFAKAKASHTTAPRALPSTTAQHGAAESERFGDASEPDRKAMPGGLSFPSERIVTNVQGEFEALEVQASSIGTSDGYVNFGSQYPDGRYYIESAGKSIGFANGQWGDVTPKGLKPRGTYDPDKLQEETIRVLESEGAKRSKPAEPAQPPGDAARPDESAKATPEAPEFTTLKDRDGNTVTVRTADLSSARERMPMFTKDGKRKTTWIHRDNLDPTGEKQAEGAKEMAGNPLFNVITTKDGGAFAIKAAARRELNARGLAETHEVVPAGDVQAGMKGYLVRKKAPDQAGSAESIEVGSVRFVRSRVEKGDGKKTDGFSLEFDNNAGGKGYIDIAEESDRIYPVMVDNGRLRSDDSTKGAVSKVYEQAIELAQTLGKPFTSDDSVTVSAARIYDSLARKGYGVEKSPNARLATSPEVVSDRWMTDDGSPVFTVRSKTEAAPMWRTVKSKPFADEASAVLALMNAAQKPSQSEEVVKAVRALARSAEESGDATARGIATFIADNALEALASHKVNAGRGSVVEKARHKKLKDGIERLRSLEVERVTRGDEAPAAVASQPTHKDPGQPAEPVTQPVIAEAIQKSARNTDFNPAEAKAWILGEIDKAIAGVPERNADLSAEMARAKASSFDYKEAEKKYGKNGVRNKAAWDKEYSEFERMRDDRIEKTARQIGYVSFDVPGDGKFKVVNTVEKLRDFRAKVEKSPGFAKNPDRPMTYGSGMAGAINLDTEIKRIEGLSAVDRRYQGGDVLEEIGNAIEIARLKKSKDEGKLLDRFKEAAKGKDYDTWRAEQEASENGSRDESPAEQPAASRATADAWREQEFVHNGVRIYPTTVNVDGERKAMWGVESAENKAKREAGERHGFGDSLFDTQEQARAAADRQIKDDTARAELERRNAENAAEKQAKIAARKADTINGFLDGKAPNTQELIRKALDKQYRFDGVIRSAREQVEWLDENGTLEVGSFDEPKIKPMSRTQFNRATQREQDAHEKKMREAGTKTVYLVSGSEIGKYAYDYAQHLIARKNSAVQQAQAQPETAERSELPAANQSALTGPHRNPAQVSAFAPYAAGDIVAIDGQDWQVQQDMGGWYLTSTGNWRGMHPTIQKIRGMNELIAEIERAATEQPASDRDQFTVERVDEDQRQTLTFKRGETVKVSGKYPMETGQIDGISNARKEFRIGGAWLPFGYAYKAEYDEFAAPRRELEEMVANAEKRIADGNGFQRDGYPIRDAREHAKRYGLGGYDDTLNDLAKRGQATFDRSVAEDRARMAAAEQTDRERREAADAADAAKYAGPVKMTMDEWKRIHRDFKSFNGGNRTVMQDGRIRRVEIVKEKAEAPATEAPAGYAAQHEALMASVRAGKATPEAFKASFEQVVANEAAIKAELSRKTKAELLREGGPYLEMRYANEKKDGVVDAVYRQMIGEYALGESVTYGMARDSYQKAVRRMVEATDADKLAQYVRDREAAIQEAEVRRTARAEAMANPQTLNDYRSLMNAHIREGKTRHEAFLMLTPEQRIRYDELEAEGTREARETRKRAAQNEVRAAGQTTGGQIIATKHTRDGYDLFVVQLAERLSREDYNTVLAGAKRLGGRYSAFRGNGAVPGFQFRTREDAEAFLKLAGGDVAAAKDQVEQRRDAFADDKSQTAAERLVEMADRMEQDASAEESRDRKANTARRARFASAALNAAAAQKAMARTMRNIAQAIQEGRAKFLDAVRTRTQVEALLGYVRTAKDKELRAKYPSYAEQEKRKGEPATAETAGFADFPSYTAFRSDLAMLGRQMLEVDGTKKLGQKLMSVADDVTDAYLEFARDNIRAVSQFGRGDALAEFASRDDAERAIRRSGLVGKAIVLPIKRGQNRVILSPSEAMSRKVWAGDGDKRITLSGEFGKELVEAIGRRGNKTNGLAVPWQFQNAYDRRKLLSRIGIETPSEFRSALREVIALQETAVANKVREMELAMVGRRADGLDFFPTPAEIADQMVEAADIKPDMAVLEPSAGMGHIADRIREAGAEPDVIEISAERRELLEEKGYHLAAVNDFLNMEPRKFFTYGDIFRAPDGVQGVMHGVGHMGSQRVRLEDEQGNRLGLYNRDEVVGVAHRGVQSGYDRIIMNPPFSDRRDAEHVQHAYTLLRPGGRIVAIMGEGVFFGQDKRAQDFRDWLDSVGGTSEKLPEGSFMDPSLPVQTGVNARMVVIDRPAVDDGIRRPGDADPEVAFSATLPRDRNAVRIGITEKGLVRAMRLQFDGLADVTSKLLERGRAGKRGGVIVVGTADNAEIGRIVAERTGRKLDSTMRKFSSAGRINGFYDPKSGLTFLVGPNLNPVTATAVMLHEMMHGQQRQKIDARALEMVRNRHSLKDEDLRAFLDRVMLRMIAAGEVGNAAEASAYIVEQAVIEGRSAGYAFADNAFMQWVDAKIGKRVGDFLRSFAGMIRTWMLRNGLGAKAMTVDDFVGYAMAGLDRAVAGEVRGRANAQASIGARAPQSGRSVGDAPAQEAQRVQSAIEGRTLIEAAQFLTRSKDGAKAAVAQKVLEKLQRLEKAGVALDLKIVHRGDMAPASMVNARGYTETGFDEKGRDIVVWLNGADVTGKVGTEEEVLLHELVHAATAGMVFYGTQTPDSLAGKHARDLMAVTDAIAEHIRRRFDAADAGKATLTAFEQDMREGANNAFRSDDEVLAWALSSGEAQAYLETIPYRSGSMWSNFVQAVRNLLGLSARNDTALSEVLRVAERILTDDAPNAGRAAFWHKRNIRMAQQQARGSIAQTAERGGDDLQFSRSGMQQAARNIGAGLKAITVQDVKKAGKHKLTDWLRLGLQFLGRRQLTDVYGDVLPLADYDRLAAQMEADKNDVGAAADELARRWGKLPDEGKLADLMHDATLAQIDADSAVEYAPGDDLAASRALKAQFNQLSGEAQKVYREARDHYRKHHAEVRQAIIDRIMRSELREERRTELLKRMDADFFKAIKGVYFPLARFGQYVVVTKDNAGKVASVSRAETMAEAEAMRAEMVKAFPARDGYQVGRVILSKEFVAGRDMVGRGFMTELYEALDEQGLDPSVQAELEDTLGQLYLSSLPDLSWAKHGIHRKGTPGFSSDARRAFAQNTFHGARYLAKLKYGDQMQAELDRMQKHVDEMAPIEGFDQPAAQRVVDEMNKRHEATMNPKGNPLSTALTSFGFVYYLGISPAAAVVNLSQTPLVAYPVMGAKWGFRKAGAALMAASAEVAEGKNDLRAVLADRLKNEQDPKAKRKHQDEIAAYDEAVRTGVIDVTMAHDLAGIAQGEDAKVMWKIRPVMRLASYLFHHAERFNRQATFLASYRLARDAGAKHDTAYSQAVKATYDGHFDYSTGNRPRVMQGNVAKVVLLFKQYAQNMIYTIARNAYQSVKGESPEVRREARKVFGALMTMHAAAAGVLGLPMVGTLLTLASALGGSDDEPWDAEVALRNMLADTFGAKPAEVIARGFSRLTPWDISGRVGLDKLLLPDVNESLEGQRWAESFATAMLGPVIGIGVNVSKGAQKMADGDYGRGLEDMLPIFARNPIKAYRQYSDGEVDRTGVVIKDEVSLAGVLGQASGFSPSEIRLAFEGRSAVMSADRRLNERRQDLMTQFARAAMDQDQDGMTEARAAIAEFNKVNPGRRITPPQMWQSVRSRERRIREADDGVYLPRTRRDVVDEGRFAEVG